jgi:hypothetical protein
VIEPRNDHIRGNQRGQIMRIAMPELLTTWSLQVPPGSKSSAHVHSRSARRPGQCRNWETSKWPNRQWWAPGDGKARPQAVARFRGVGRADSTALNESASSWVTPEESIVSGDNGYDNGYEPDDHQLFSVSVVQRSTSRSPRFSQVKWRPELALFKAPMSSKRVSPGIGCSGG